MVFGKKLTLLIFWVVLCGSGRAQETTAVLLEQLAALKGYSVTLQEGYRIAREGLTLIRDVKKGEFHLHQVFFGSLKNVDEAALASPALAEAFLLLDATEQEFARAVSTLIASGWMRTEEGDYLHSLQVKLADQGRKDTEALGQLSQDGQLSMTDGERLGEIGMIAGAVRSRYVSIKNFLTNIAWIVAQRQSAGAFTGTLKKWYGIQ